MAVKVLVVSDNHGSREGLEIALRDNYDCDYYLHLGDSCMPPEDLKPFISVLGNNDYGFDYPINRIVEIGGIKFLMNHGSYDNNVLATKAIVNDCKYILCGHTHVFTDIVYKDIRILNPGSLYYNRDFTPPCYAIMRIDNKKNVTFERVNIDLE